MSEVYVCTDICWTDGERQQRRDLHAALDDDEEEEEENFSSQQ